MLSQDKCFCALFSISSDAISLPNHFWKGNKKYSTSFAKLFYPGSKLPPIKMVSSTLICSILIAALSVAAKKKEIDEYNPAGFFVMFKTRYQLDSERGPQNDAIANAFATARNTRRWRDTGYDKFRALSDKNGVWVHTTSQKIDYDLARDILMEIGFEDASWNQWLGETNAWFYMKNS